MPYHLSYGGGTCGSTQWAVIKDSDGTTMGCHDSKSEANDQLAALYTNEPGVAESVPAGRFHVTVDARPRVVTSACWTRGHAARLPRHG